MRHIAYPNVYHGQFVGCVRYLSLPPSQALGPPYQQANPRTPHLQVVHDSAGAGRWPEPAVVLVGTRELRLLVDMLFERPS
jgi:hypothetical protein